MANKQVKRRVKDPDSFRERALKATSAGGGANKKPAPKPARRPVIQPLGRAARTVFDRQPFRLLRRPIRLVGRVLVPKYFRTSWKELRQVTWPGWRESRRLTFAVLIFAIIFGAAIALVDYGLDKVFRDLLLK